MTREPIAYIAAPLSAPTREGIEANRARAARWTAWVARNGVSPIATWIVLTGEWDETTANRRRGLEVDCRVIEICDVILHVGGRVTDGMRKEGNHAIAHRVPILDLTALGREPPAFPFPLLEKIREVIASSVCVLCLGRPPIDGCAACGAAPIPDEVSAPGVPR